MSKKKKKASSKSKGKTKDKLPKKLRGVHDLRRFFYRNETPIYFISATNFNLLGADEWIKGFKFITYIECFDGLHPNVISPQEEMPHEEFTSIEDIVNYLLEHKEVVDYIQSRGPGKAMFLMFDEKTEKLAEQLGLELAFPDAALRNYLDNKVVTNRIAEKADVPTVPNVLTNVDSFKTLRKVSKHLGEELVVQTPYGDSGHTTFFINNEEDWKKHADEIIEEDEVKVMKRINCMGAAMEACVTKNGTIVAPLMTELVGFKELTPYKGGWCGNEIYAGCFTPKIRRKARKYAEQFGDQLRKEGYKGYFELDFLIDTDSGDLYLGELNPRITGASSITNHAVFALADVPLFMFHIMEWMDRDYQVSVNAINQRWHLPENIDEWGQMVIKHTEDSILQLKSAPKSGIYQIDEKGKIHFNRMDTHRRAVESDSEAFFLRIMKKGEYLYEGADMGIVVMRGRLMTDDFLLNDRARIWINAIRGEFEAVEPDNLPLIENKVAEIGGFKMM